jgi:hypothetical protein
MPTKGTPVVIKILVKINNMPTGDFATIDGYLFNPSERDQLHAYFLEEVEKDTTYVYEMWKACDALGGRVYLANTDPVFNPQTTIICDKGHTQILGYFLTGASLEEKGYIEPSGGWIEVVSSHPIPPVVNDEDDSITSLEDLPDHMFLTSWLAAGNVFMPSLPDNFEKWLIELGLSLEKHTRIMNLVTLRGADVELFDSALKHHLAEIDNKSKNKVTSHFNKVRGLIAEIKMRK